MTAVTRPGRILLRVDRRIFAVILGDRLVLSLPPGRAEALVFAALATRLDPGEDSLLPGWVVLGPCEMEVLLGLAREACDHARSQNRLRPMSPASRGCHMGDHQMLEKGAPVSAPFVWFDLETGDEPATLAFYSELLDWEIETGKPTMVKGTDGPWAAVTSNAARGARWLPYVQVEDVDAATEKAITLGATVVRPKRSGVAGEFSVIADPAGAQVALWQAPIAS